MIKQMFKLVWNRKRTSVLIIVEVFFSFLVLFALVAYSAYYVRNYRQPLGFVYENVWNVSMGSIFDRADQDTGGEKLKQDVRQILLALRDLPEVERATMINMTPFQIGAWSGSITYKGREASCRFNDATEELKDVMDLKLVQGRWFEPADDALNFDPVVINARLRDELFGKDDPIGKQFDPENTPDPLQPKRIRRVVGVITDFRQHGELHEPYNYLFFRKTLESSPAGPSTNLLIRLRPGTPASFEEKLMRRLQSVARDRSFQIEPLARARRAHMRWVLVPMAAAALVAGFLMLMVALGMVGVLWQNVSRRTREIGVRRALGGHAGDIYKQILGELLVVATIALLFGVAVAVQAPLLGLLEWMTPGIFAASLALSLLLIYALTMVAGLYPSHLATKVQPAGALHYE